MATIKSIEEKAKAYDEALVRANEMIKDMTNIGGVAKVDDIQYIFPELKESEDERIMKALYKMAKVPRKEIYEAEGITKEQALAWLEKQGKQKETLCDKCKKTQPSHSCQDITALGRCALEKQGEQKLTEFERAVKQVMEEAIECGDTRNLKADAEMLLSLVHKPAWSEEDETNLRRTEYAVMKFFGGDCSLVGWLRKSLKERCTWKPSDEQMETLENVRKILHSNKEIYSKINRFMFNFEELIRTLKKLREE